MKMEILARDMIQFKIFNWYTIDISYLKHTAVYLSKIQENKMN